MQSQGNIRVVEMLRYLYQHTDENHTATVTDITAYLKERGIQAVRQTVYADLNALITAGFDIVIVKSTQNQYFMGNRLFEYPELKMLADAVASSKIISAKGLASLSSRVIPGNEKVYYIIDSIHSAILEHRQIEFQYYEYTQTKEKILKHDGYRYLLNPYALEWKNDHYYLIGYSHKHNRVAHFRVDRLAGVEVLSTEFAQLENFDVAAYTNTMIDMFASEGTLDVELQCDNELMRVIIDHYGEMDGFLNLEEALPADLYEQVKDYLYPVTNAETGQEAFCGIRIGDTSFGEKTGLILEDPVLTIMSNSPHTDTAIQLIRYIFEQ